MPEIIGFIGLGSMGRPIAGRLMSAGHFLRVYNRTPQKAALLVKRGAEAVDTPREVVQPDGIVMSMLAGDQALEDVVFGEHGILSQLGRGGVHVAMSTVAPATARRMAEEHRHKGATYLAAPVFGRPDAAAAGKLWIVLSGDDAAKQRVRPLLETLSQGVHDFGEEVGAANVVKLAGNFLIASAMEAMAEAFTLGEKSGIDRTRLAELFGETLFACPIYRNYGRAIAEHQYHPAGFRLSLGFKDICLVLGAAEAAQSPMPFASMLRDRLLGLMAQGCGEMDWSGLAGGVSEAAGIKPKS